MRWLGHPFTAVRDAVGLVGVTWEDVNRRPAMRTTNPASAAPGMSRTPPYRPPFRLNEIVEDLHDVGDTNEGWINGSTVRYRYTRHTPPLPSRSLAFAEY